MATIPSTLPRCTPVGPFVMTGNYRQVIDAVGATRTLAPEESGALCLFDSAAGNVYTLPPPSAQTIGMQFEFLTKVTVTSNSAKIITDAATTFLVGAAALLNNAAATGEAFSANGTTHRSVNGNGTTTGGIIGDRIRVTCISATLWAVDAVMVQSGTAATPFATS